MGLRGQERMFGPQPGSVADRVLSVAPARGLALPPGVTDAEWLRASVAANPDTQLLAITRITFHPENSPLRSATDLLRTGAYKAGFHTVLTGLALAD
jgi:hypothetical protein